MVKFQIIIILFCFTLVSCQQKKQEVKIKPNIIFLLTDDQNDNTFGAMGHPVIHSPNVDKLIKEGVLFSNTYIAEPTCSPSRVALFTGMHERINGVGFTSSYQLTEEQWGNTYPALLKRNGYFTGFIGKFGVEYYTFKGNAKDKFDYYWGHDGWTKFFPKNHNSFSTKPYHKAKNKIITPIMGEAIEDFLTTKSNEKPFCLSVSLSVPHGSQTSSMNEESAEAIAMVVPANENPELKGHPIYDNLYRDLDIQIPAETATDPYRFIPKKILDQNKGRANKTYKYDYHPISCKEHHIRYYQQITGIDKVIGDLIISLKKRGLSENTIIIFASDHGLLMGEYGMGGKALLYDLTSKIPCFIFDPRLPESKKGKTIDQLVSSLDLTTTILDYAGIKATTEMEGSSLIPLINGENVAWRDEIFLENLYTGRDNPFCEGIRQQNWKYIRMYNGVEKYSENDLSFENRKPDFEQLFNLKDDPQEMVNLIYKYEGSTLLKELREKTIQQSGNLNLKRENYKKNNKVVSR
ncbi:MAG: sulfatase-like hydrolase/transferase [Bacteroidetes bacterium]|nr:sulfatase-like hydrolase/transferase [Bacteroidota bacterium]